MRVLIFSGWLAVLWTVYFALRVWPLQPEEEDHVDNQYAGASRRHHGTIILISVWGSFGLLLALHLTR